MIDLENTNPITVADLTEAKVTGKGVFDVLMSAMAGHLELEFDRQRIKGQEYSQVYLGALSAVLSNSVSFLLQKDEAALKAALAAEQVKLTILQQALMQAQIDKLKAETINVITENDTMKAQQCLLKAQYDQTMQMVIQTTAQTSLIQQKIATEKAQTVGAGVDENSVIGKQIMLYKAQADGFQRDAEQKAAKIFTDTWNVRRTTDEATVADVNNMLYDPAIGRAMTVLLAGIKG